MAVDPFGVLAGGVRSGSPPYSLVRGIAGDEVPFCGAS